MRGYSAVGLIGTRKDPKIEAPLATFEAGEWAACGKCYPLHETGQIESLVERCLMSPANKKAAEGIASKDFVNDLKVDLCMIYSQISRTGRYLRIGEKLSN